jgi:hypothetical protein
MNDALGLDQITHRLAVAALVDKHERVDAVIFLLGKAAGRRYRRRGDPIPTDPIAVRGDLPDGFKRRLVAVLQNLDLSSLDEKDRKVIMGGPRWVPQTDQAYDGIRDLVKTLNIDLAKLD